MSLQRGRRNSGNPRWPTIFDWVAAALAMATIIGSSSATIAWRPVSPPTYIMASTE